MRVRTRSVNVRLNDGDAETVLLAVPLGEFGRGRGLSLTVGANQQKRGASGLEIRGGAKNTNQFGVKDVHGVRLHRQAGSWLFLPHSRFQAVHDLLGLTDVEIRFLKSGEGCVISRSSSSSNLRLFLSNPSERKMPLDKPSSAMQGRYGRPISNHALIGMLSIMRMFEE